MLVSRLVSMPQNDLLHPSLRRDILLGFLLLLLIGLATTLLAKHVFDRQTGFINLVDTAGHLRMLSQRIAFVAHRIDTDPRQPNPEQQELRRLIRQFEHDLGELERVNQEMGAFVVGQSDGDAGLAIIKEQWLNYRRAAETVISTNPPSPQFITALRAIDDNALPLLATAENNARHIVQHSISDRVDLRVVMLITLLMGAVFLLAAFIYMRRKLLRPYSIISRMADNLAAGDFSARAEYDGDGEAGALVKRLNLTAAAIQDLFVERLRVEEALRQEITGHKITEEQLRTLSLTVENPRWMARADPLGGQPAQALAEPLTKTEPAAGLAELGRRLTSVPGLDFERGLSLVRGNSTKYARMLALFADSHAQDTTRLSECLATNDLVTVRNLAHTLKGSAGMIGATWVSEAAAVLQSAIQRETKGDEINGCCTMLVAELTPLIESIRGVLNQGALE